MISRSALGHHEIRRRGDEHRSGHDRQPQPRPQPPARWGSPFTSPSECREPLIERLALADKGLERRSRSFSPDPEAQAVAGKDNSGETTVERGESGGREPERSGDRYPRNGVGGKSVQNGTLEAGALRRLRVRVQRIPVAREAIDEGGARIDAKCRDGVRLALRDDRQLTRRRLATELRRRPAGAASAAACDIPCRRLDRRWRVQARRSRPSPRPCPSPRAPARGLRPRPRAARARGRRDLFVVDQLGKIDGELRRRIHMPGEPRVTAKVGKTASRSSSIKGRSAGSMGSAPSPTPSA